MMGAEALDASFDSEKTKTLDGSEMGVDGIIKSLVCDEDDDDEPIVGASKAAQQRHAAPKRQQAAETTTMSRCERRLNRRAEAQMNRQVQDESDDDGALQLRRNSGARKPGKKRARPVDADISSPEDDQDLSVSDNELALKTSTRERDRKSRLIGQILARWWYCMDPWPPLDFDFPLELAKRKLKQVSFDAWEEADDIDPEGFQKVYEITHFPGMFRSPKGEVIDLRPEDGKPCYRFLAQKSENELHKMLKKALENQLLNLERSPYKISDASLVEKTANHLREMLKAGG